MKQDLLLMENKLSFAEATKARVCVKCVGYESLLKNCAKLETSLKIHEDQLKEKENLISGIPVQFQQTILDNTVLQKENRNLLEQVERLSADLNGRKEDATKLERTLEKERQTMEEVQERLLDEQQQISACVMQLEVAQQLSQYTQEKNKLLSEEIELLNLKLTQSKTEFDNAKAQKMSLEDNRSRKEALMQAFVLNLQSEIQTLQQFFQRLCGDLKLALHTSINQSKVLKKHVQTLSSEAKECSSLPDALVNLPSPASTTTLT